MTSSSKQIKQKTEQRKTKKLVFLKIIGRKCKLIKIRDEQNDDHARIMHKIQFRSSFKYQ